MERDTPSGAIVAMVRAFLGGKGSLLFLLFAFFAGAAALQVTPREEEPQIVVPMADVFVQVPGASAREVEQLVATPLERILWQIDGVEHVYSVSRRDAALATVRFYVGEDRERSLIKLYNAISKHTDIAPGIVSAWVVKPVEIDDVAIVNLTLASARYDDHALRRVAEEWLPRLAEVEDVSRVAIVGGRAREVRVELLPERLAGLNVSPLEIVRALQAADASVTAGGMDNLNLRATVSVDSFLYSAEEVADLVVGVFDDRPVYVRDVAYVIDGPQEPVNYSRLTLIPGRGEAVQGADATSAPQASMPAVTLAVSKKKGSNAVTVAENVLARIEDLKLRALPDEVIVEITRNYGQTAQSKVDELIESLFFAVLTVIVLLALMLGWREALIVALSVPASFALALAVNYLLGYSINRVTLFALILSLGLVVDDPITNVDNIQRHILAGRRNPFQATLYAVQEVLPPVILSTLAIIVCFVPLFFITGTMGPYMAPMAANVPLTVTFSTLCALTFVPWLSWALLKSRAGGSVVGVDVVPAWVRRGYRALLLPFLESRARRIALYGIILVLLVGCVSLGVLGQVPLKLLPFDNKNEFQLVLDLPDDTSLEATDRVVRVFEDYLQTVPEVVSVVSTVGTSSPMDFNGMIRHYYLRDAFSKADLRVNLVHKDRREQQSHDIVLRLRKDLETLAAGHAVRLKIVELPPGPPVLATLTAEIYGAPDRGYRQIIDAARHVQKLMRDERGVCDVDASFETERRRVDFVPDKEKAALHGVSTADIVQTLGLAVGGKSPAKVHLPDERQPLPVRLVLPRDRRSSVAALTRIPVKSTSGDMVELGELGVFVEKSEDQPIYHKNLKPVVFVYGEMAGWPPIEAIFGLQKRLAKDPLPPGTMVEWAGEGEWELTVRVFRDLGLAFAAALLAIYLLLVMQTDSFVMPLLIMLAIPLTLLGIMPGFWMLNLLFASPVGGFPNPIFFTATSMIGMIALGGIVIRNSLVLIEFVRDARAEGLGLKEALLQSGAVRLRPIVLTAFTSALGAWPITLDPIFSGLAWALIFGLAASTVFTLLIVPTVYYESMARREGRMPPAEAEGARG